MLFDTNILIDHFAGIEEVTAELERYEDAAITTITWLEVLSGAEPHELQDMRDYMAQFIVYDLDDVIAEEAAAIRRTARIAGRKILKSPDAAVLATARYTGRKLITRDIKDFSGADVHVPYALSRDPESGEVVVAMPPPMSEQADVDERPSS
ncbi:PIN domain-containing protein [Rugamonas sp. DEMB1]|uniref:PIN domain-containing protein n=1 Tax=Rugamonas sp. DEMB1 TaxID=3039386 RepID=UPI00244AFDAD|nr:PIN domain-containing protein [Rugamonas sp. DEMB1]WGG52622.1 PIN domain-containing protein [Rugamonas sp. DEMB1]